ncbi:deoxynucleoside triphosphate triphosphohydrolase SAMHD1 isoform X1 [Oreochromis niloticus]|uniref:deoxynucleoside triphosphate triphosphohydrolase SAMHD1 isoform X1 n=1 Tax=Oreochromis niloticus TaxID=8128 RepID=UPI000904951F|nr:deoxynucleoside triphosphate triphosphohydrolase SAMHD1 isoform X1 [Oreochromis niloticus]
MAKPPFMMGRYKWLVKVLSVGAECKGEDPNAEPKKPTSTKQQNTTADNEAKNNIPKKPRFYIEEHKVFNDPIHGHMALHPVLVKIIDTPEFQRLRNIKQLGGIYFVYPGASHNRFEHSIGVAHLAGELAKALKMKQEKQIEQLEELKKLKLLMELTPEELKLKELKHDDLRMLKKLEKLDDKELEELKNLKTEEFEKLNKFKKLRPEDVEKFEKLREFKPNELEKLKESLISDRDVLCVQIAGLCHDLGHGPYSHFYDGMFMEAIRDKKGKEFNGKWEHEDASIEMFNHLLDNTDGLKDMMRKSGLKIEGDDKTDLKFIEELIRGPPRWPYKGRDEKKSFLYEIVSNKETGIDVDKFDYFARDCKQLGIPNSFDHQRFIMFARVCDVEEDGRKHICSRDKEIENLYDIFHTRLSIHRRACQHKIKMAVEIMIKDALLLVDDHPDFKIKSSKGKMLSLSEAKDDMEAYIKLTDHVIERILHPKEERKEEEKLKEATKILQRVVKRDLYRCVGQARKKEGREKWKEFKENLREELCKQFPECGKKDFEVIDVPFDYGMKSKDPLRKAYFYRKDNPDKGEPIPKSKVSRLLVDCFSDEMFRVYWKNHENLEGEERDEKEKEIKEVFKKWCKDNGLEIVEER